MRKKYITLSWILSAALWTGGCSNEEEQADGRLLSNSPVTFFTEVTTDGATRGTLINDFPSGAGVGLYGYCCDENGQYGRNDWAHKKAFCTPDENLFNDTPMTFDGAVWDYAGLKSWYADPEYYYAFFAYYPYSGAGIAVQTENSGGQPIGDPILTYTMPFNQGGQTTTERSQDGILDVLYASRIDWQNTSGAPVPLSFAHLMTGLEFEVENYGGAPVRINDLRIQGTFHHSASVQLSDITTSGTYSGYFPIIQGRTETYEEATTPHKVNDADGKLVELMLLADYDNNTIGQNIEVSVSYDLGTGSYTNEVISLPAMTFQPGVKNIIRLEFIGSHVVLSCMPGNNWTLGGDDEIIFD